ncbi:MAG: protease HtpX [bacterium]
MFKRILLFAAVNLLVMLTISILLSVLGVRPYLHAYGIDLPQLMIFCLIWGMGGSLISLFLSRSLAKWTMGVQVIDPQTTTPELAALVNRVHSLAQRAGLPKMPEVGIYDSEELNAFATGPTKSSALVAVSTGLLRRMDSDEVEGVLGHELTHVSNGDMVTMTLLQGVVNAFVMFFARVIAFGVSQGVKEESRRTVNYLVTMLLEMTLSILGFIVVAGFSRWREFRADHGGAQLAGTQKMVGALRALQRNMGIETGDESAALSTLKISGGSRGLTALFATHPPLEERIRRLQEGLS